MGISVQALIITTLSLLLQLFHSIDKTMKLVVASTAVLNLVLAGSNQQQSLFTALASNNNSTDRNLLQMFISSEYRPYGCWCYIGQDYRHGKSMPKDELDGFCKVLHDGYECAAIEIEGCRAFDVEYEAVFSDDIVNECETQNAGADECAIAACKVESHFVHNVFNAFFAGFNIAPELQHANGFDTTAECPKMAGNPNPTGMGGGGNGSGTPRQCCGSFPEIEIYKPNKHDCCNSVNVFNPSMMTCCDDGRVVNIGNSC